MTIQERLGIQIGTVNIDNMHISMIGGEVSPVRQPRIQWAVCVERGVTIRGYEMSFSLPDDKTAVLSIKPVDAHGHDAPIDGKPEWTVSDPTFATLEVAEDGLSATVLPTGTSIGTFQVSVSVDADLGEGVETLSGLLDVEVVAGKAVNLEISASLA